MYKLNLDKNRNVYVVTEINSNKVIYESSVYDNAYSVYRKQKQGCGFQGDTPDFFKKVVDNLEQTF